MSTSNELRKTVSRQPLSCPVSCRTKNVSTKNLRVFRSDLGSSTDHLSAWSWLTPNGWSIIIWHSVILPPISEVGDQPPWALLGQSITFASVTRVLRMHFYTCQHVIQIYSRANSTRRPRWFRWPVKSRSKILRYRSLDLEAWSSSPQLLFTRSLGDRWGGLGIVFHHCWRTMQAYVARPISRVAMRSLHHQSKTAKNVQSWALIILPQLFPFTLHTAL